MSVYEEDVLLCLSSGVSRGVFHHRASLFGGQANQMFLMLSRLGDYSRGAPVFTE